MALSCSLVKEERISCPFTAPVNVHLSGFSYIQEELPDTRATVSGYNGIQKLTLAFYSAGASAGSFQLNTTWDDDYNKNF